jgi:hypothetical protein
MRKQNRVLEALLSIAFTFCSMINALPNAILLYAILLHANVLKLVHIESKNVLVPTASLKTLDVLILSSDLMTTLLPLPYIYIFG